MSELLLGARRTGRDKTPKDPEPGKAFPCRGDRRALGTVRLAERPAMLRRPRPGHPPVRPQRMRRRPPPGLQPLPRRGRSKVGVLQPHSLGPGPASSTTPRSPPARPTTPPCAPWATAGWRSAGTACASASPTTKPHTPPTATRPPNPPREVDRGCLTTPAEPPHDGEQDRNVLAGLTRARTGCGSRSASYRRR